MLEEPISEAGGAREPLTCELIDTNETVRETLNTKPVFDLLQSRSAQEANVWFSDGGTSAAGRRIDAWLLILDESVRSGLRAQRVLDGLELKVCPQLRPT